MRWSNSTSDNAFFSQNPSGLMHQLAKAHRFRFGSTPFQQSDAVVDFNVTGFDRVLPTMTRECATAK
jgi:hypothetical protein